jgi:hypothetical protein
MLRKKRAVTSLASAMVILSACASNDDITGTKPSLRAAASPQLEIAASVGGRTERGIEDEILKMEKFVPGLGGVFSENGVLVVYAPASAAPTEVMSGLASASPFLSLDANTRGRIARGEGIEIRPSRYPFSQLVAWTETSAVLFAVKGVSWTDADERLNKLTVSVTDDRYRADVLRIALSLGIPSDAINISVAPSERASVGLRDQWSQTGSGIQITNFNSQLCSIGWNVHRGGSDPETSEEGFITAGHCATGQPGLGVTGPMYQPVTSTYPNYRIGYITQNPSWNVSDTACTNAGVSYCARVDAMYVKYDDYSVSLKRVPYTGTDPGTNSNPSGTSVAGWWTSISNSYYLPWVGDNVDKVGRTTGWTRGTLSATCANTRVTEESPYSDYMVLCADKVSNASAGQGDSGGPVFVPQTTQPLLPVGVLISAGGSLTGTPGQLYCNANCIYSYSRMSRIALFLPEPPY